ncbi:MAG: C45 family peptidase [Phycisphaerales bacterium]
MGSERSIRLDFRAITDGVGSDALVRVFDEYWPAFRKWIDKSDTSDAGACIDAFRAHMPELVPAFESLLDRLGGGDDVARFLSLYNPPRVVRACSQLVVESDGRPVILRTYDHHPDLFDGVVLASAWSGRDTLAVTDCLWGALDGVNAEGLAVVLAFGGRKTVGDGFAAPMIVRYLLETCSTTADARLALERLPIAMPYTFVVLDAQGDFVTAFLGPRRTARFVGRRASTNHQGRVEWPAYAKHVESVPRLRLLERILSEPDAAAVARRRFLEPPLWRRDYARASGTLYASALAPRDRTLTLLWPGEQRAYRVGETIDDAFAVELEGGAAPVT